MRKFWESFCAVAVVLLLLFGYANVTKAQSLSKPDLIEIISLTGYIGDAAAERLSTIVANINANKQAKAVVLILDSPGGGVVATGNAYEELSKLKLPVVVWCSSICASGAVHLSMAPPVKYIGVRTETIGGSVGVIMYSANYSRLLDWAKVDSKVYKSGPLKDSGNPNRAETKADQEYLQGMIDELASRIYAVVEKGRGSKIKDWKSIKTARIYFGKSIVDVGLADQVMTHEQVIAKAKELSGSKNVYTRDEIKKMSESLSESPSPSYYRVTPPEPQEYSIVFKILKDIHVGSSIRFEYLMPYQF